MTLLQIVNKVLIRLREAQLGATSDSEYGTLLAEFVNETKREIEDAHNWTALRNTISFNTVQGTTAYTLSGAGQRSVIFDVYETTTKTTLPKGDAIRMKAEIEEGSQSQPSRYFIEGIDSNNDIKMNVSLTPDAVYTYNVHLKTPQADLVDATVSTMDSSAIVLGTYSKALEERGEDAGTQASSARDKYVLAVGDVIAIDIALTGGEDTWYV